MNKVYVVKCRNKLIRAYLNKEDAIKEKDRLEAEQINRRNQNEIKSFTCAKCSDNDFENMEKDCKYCKDIIDNKYGMYCENMCVFDEYDYEESYWVTELELIKDRRKSNE